MNQRTTQNTLALISFGFRFWYVKSENIKKTCFRFKYWINNKERHQLYSDYSVHSSSDWLIGFTCWLFAGTKTVLLSLIHILYPAYFTTQTHSIVMFTYAW